MKTLSINTATVLAFLALAFGAYAVVKSAIPVEASVYNATAISSATTSAAFAVTTSTRVLATTTNTLGTGYTRVYATICNPNANPVFLNMNTDAPANLPGGKYVAVIAAAAGYNACYEITDRNQYSGSVQASSTNQTSTNVTVIEYVQ